MIAKKKSLPARIAFYAALTCGALVMLHPLAWMIGKSFLPESAIFREGGSFALTLENYSAGWAGPTGVSFTRYYLNSFLMVGCIVLANVVSCTLTAFAFSRLRFTGQKAFFAIMLGSMMLPYHVVLIPRFIMFNAAQLTNTYFPLILPKLLATDGFFIFLITQFMRGIPIEYDKSAALDGASAFKVFSAIVLPLAKPAVITTVIFSFIWNWNDFLTQLLYISDPAKMTVTLALRLFLDATGVSHWGSLFAMSTLSLVPVFIIFLSCQKYLTEGVAATGLKG